MTDFHIHIMHINGMAEEMENRDDGDINRQMPVYIWSRLSNLGLWACMSVSLSDQQKRGMAESLRGEMSCDSCDADYLVHLGKGGPLQGIKRIAPFCWIAT